MADLQTAKEKVKESLLGTTQAADIQLSALSKATFEKNARKDDESAELLMGEEDFINAIAPDGEDYVSKLMSMSHKTSPEWLADKSFWYIA